VKILGIVIQIETESERNRTVAMVATQREDLASMALDQLLSELSRARHMRKRSQNVADNADAGLRMLNKWQVATALDLRPDVVKLLVMGLDGCTSLQIGSLHDLLTFDMDHASELEQREKLALEGVDDAHREDLTLVTNPMLSTRTSGATPSGTVPLGEGEVSANVEMTNMYETRPIVVPQRSGTTEGKKVDRRAPWPRW